MNKNRERNIAFFDRWAQCYDAAIFQFFMKRFFRRTLAAIDHSGRVLDVSCGTGELLVQLRKKGVTAYGSDISPVMLQHARAKGCVVLRADVHALPFKDNAFDDVISTEAFHHYGNQQEALAAMVRVAKPGGKVIVSDVTFYLFNRLFERWEPGCVHILDRRELWQLFETAGLLSVTQSHGPFVNTTMGVKPY